MDISINGKGLDIGDALRGHVGTALTSIVGKYFPRAHDAVVTVSREAHLFRADVTVHPTRGFVVQGRAAADDAYAAVDGAVERIAKQLRRYKRRLNDHHGRRPAEEGMPAQQYIIAAESDEEELPAEGQPAIIAEIATEIATDISGVPTRRGGEYLVFWKPSGENTKMATATQPTVTLKQIASELAESQELTKKQLNAIMDEMVEQLVKNLKKGNRIRIAGLGILQVKKRAARMGRNPATGEQIKIPAKKKIAFRPAKELKEAVGK